MLNEYSQMLLESARQVYKIINNPECTEENKMIIAGANTLAQTSKTAIQLELLQYKASYTGANTSQIIHKVNK